MHVFEEPFYLTKTEAGYCLLISGVTAEAGRGTDIGAKAEALIQISAIPLRNEWVQA